MPRSQCWTLVKSDRPAEGIYIEVGKTILFKYGSVVRVKAASKDECNANNTTEGIKV